MDGLTAMSFTCIACRVAFHTADLQRSHYRTDWHRYNLKRKVAELPPVSAEAFQQKVLAQRNQRAATASPRHCKSCNKKFSTDNAYTDHLKSRKHRASEARLSRNSEAQPKDNKDSNEIDQEELEEEIIEGDEPVEVTNCLFCEHESRSVEDNVKHMARSHSFFIPEVEYLVGLKSLIGYLGAKVGTGHVCVWCNRQFDTLEAVRHHMVDRSHTLMLYDDSSRDEYADFYDFRSSYPDFDQQSADKSEEEEEEEAMEMESDGRAQVAMCDDEIGELVLPSGARVGHRALRRYYRQSFGAERPAESRSRIQRVIAQYQAVGWTGSADVRRLAIEKQRTELAARQRVDSRHHFQLGMKANKLQKHFRSQNFLW